jgi:hypothetical protein
MFLQPAPRSVKGLPPRVKGFPRAVSAAPISFSGSPTKSKGSAISVKLSPMPGKSAPIADLLSPESANQRIRSPRLGSQAAPGRELRASHHRSRIEERSCRQEDVGRRTKLGRRMTTFHIEC